VSGRHAGDGSVRRRFPVLLGVATVLGLWFGISAPEVSPVAPPPAVQVQAATQVTVVPPAPQTGVAP
jgi:hypothetical protein